MDTIKLVNDLAVKADEMTDELGEVINTLTDVLVILRKFAEEQQALLIDKHTEETNNGV